MWNVTSNTHIILRHAAETTQHIFAWDKVMTTHLTLKHKKKHHFTVYYFLTSSDISHSTLENWFTLIWKWFLNPVVQISSDQTFSEYVLCCHSAAVETKAVRKLFTEEDVCVLFMQFGNRNRLYDDVALKGQMRQWCTQSIQTVLINRVLVVCWTTETPGGLKPVC